MNFEEKHKQYIEYCNQEIRNSISICFQEDSVVSKAAEYSVMNGGKRVRGVLVQAVCDMLQGQQETSRNFAAAIEMIHAFSLVHDDLPCMDDDDLRRGKPSCHIEFGEANALLAGDLLSIAAFATVAGTKQANSDTVRSAISVLALASGAKGMIYGQELDIAAENKVLTVQELEKVHMHKTGALIIGAAQLGILSAGLSIEQHPAIVEYANILGVVFQIVDDVLDVIGDETILGKPVGSDDKNNKNTYISLYGLEKSIQIATKETETAILNLQNSYGESAWFLMEFARSLVNRLY